MDLTRTERSHAMPRSETPGTPGDTRSQRKLSGKAWTAIVAGGLLIITVAWVVVSVLTARPSVDPTVYTDAVALANREQQDPDAPSRYGELVEALMEYEQRMAVLAEEVVSDDESVRTGVKELKFYTVRVELDPGDEDAELIAQQASDARRAIQIAEQRELFAAIEELLRSPNLANEYSSAFDSDGELLPMHDWLLGELANWRAYSNAVVARARVATERGELEHAAEVLERAAPLPSVLTRHVTLIEHLVGSAIAALLASEIEFIATRPDLTPEALAALQRAQVRLSDLGGLDIAIEGETILMRDFHFRTHTAGGRYIPSAGEELAGSGMEPEDLKLPRRLKDAAGYLAVRRDTSIAKAEELYGLVRDAVNEPDPTRRGRIMADSDARVEALGPRHGLLRYTMPAISRVATNSFKIQAQMRGLGILLDMAAYRLGEGEWPESLEVLVPDYLDAIPVDPRTGDPFEYEYEEGEPPSLERLGVGF